jgi:hypothetical protein
VQLLVVADDRLCRGSDHQSRTNAENRIRAGLDVYRHVCGTLERGLGERFQVPSTLAERVNQGDYGTKTGAGFFSYTPEERERLFADRDRRYAALSELLERLPRTIVGGASSVGDRLDAASTMLSGVYDCSLCPAACSWAEGPRSLPSSAVRPWPC